MGISPKIIRDSRVESESISGEDILLMETIIGSIVYRQRVSLDCAIRLSNSVYCT